MPPGLEALSTSSVLRAYNTPVGMLYIESRAWCTRG